MAWLRGKGGSKDRDGRPLPPPPPVDGDIPEMLPVIQEEGTTEDREAYKRIKRAEADLRRLEKREAKARRKEEREARARARRMAAMQRSRDVGPIVLVAFIAVLNTIACIFLVISLWWPEWPPYDPIPLLDSIHWEMIIFCFIAVAVASIVVLERRPSPMYVNRAQHALGTYIGTGIIGTFVGLLIAHVLVDMELMDVDWLFWLQLMTILAFGSSLAMTLMYVIAHRAGSKAFLDPPYTNSMGLTSGILVVSLIVMPFLYLPSTGYMYEVGTSVYYVSWLMVLFPLPALVASFAVKRRSEELAPYSMYA